MTVAGDDRPVPWAVWLEPVLPVARLVELARLAEEQGATHCLVADEGTDRDVYVAMTAILLGTEHLVVAPAITNPFSRHPVTTAAAIATLAELAPGRVWHGLGVGGSRVLAPLGLEPPRPYTALAEAVDVNQRLLRGEAVGAARIPFATPVPLAVAGRGPRVKALAATRADWVILSAEPVDSVPIASECLRHEGARLVWSAYLAYDEAQRRAVLGHFSYMALDAPPDIRDRAGLDDALVDRIRAHMLAGRLDAAAELLPDSLVDVYAVAGDAERCARVVGRTMRHADLFALPMNDVHGDAEAHILAAAAILRRARAHLEEDR